MTVRLIESAIPVVSVLVLVMSVVQMQSAQLEIIKLFVSALMERSENLMTR